MEHPADRKDPPLDAEAAGGAAGNAAQVEKTRSDEPRSSTEAAADLGVDETHLVRKLDAFLIPLVMALYLFSFLDR